MEFMRSSKNLRDVGEVGLPSIIGLEIMKEAQIDISKAERSLLIPELLNNENMMAIGGTIVGIGIALVFGILFSRSITKPINHIITRLSESAEHVMAASSQVFSSSQQLAEGASEQASPLEETSSSNEGHYIGRWLFKISTGFKTEPLFSEQLYADIHHFRVVENATVLKDFLQCFIYPQRWSVRTMRAYCFNNIGYR